jgi:hypothetical protein
LKIRNQILESQDLGLTVSLRKFSITLEFLTLCRIGEGRCIQVHPRKEIPVGELYADHILVLMTDQK